MRRGWRTSAGGVLKRVRAMRTAFRAAATFDLFPALRQLSHLLSSRSARIVVTSYTAALDPLLEMRGARQNRVSNLMQRFFSGR